MAYETARRERAARGEAVPPGVDGAFICVLDEAHRDVVVALAPLNLHVMCEKPLATTLRDCTDMYRAIRPAPGREGRVFSIGHVLRYSPHNTLLRRLLVEDRVVGDVCSVEHTEPVGWWHYTHSYVRGNWAQRGHVVAVAASQELPRRRLPPVAARLAREGRQGVAAPAVDRHVVGLPAAVQEVPEAQGRRRRDELHEVPARRQRVQVLRQEHLPRNRGAGRREREHEVAAEHPPSEIEDFPTVPERKAAVSKVLEEDYDDSTPASEVAGRNWFGRCVYESDNNVCDDQFVTMTWDDEPEPTSPAEPRRFAKTATLHMAANTRKICQRYTSVYGTDGELHADSTAITTHDFTTGESRTYEPGVEHSGHGGGDLGLTRQFVAAVGAVVNGTMGAAEAQAEFVGCTLDEVLRSHAMVFAAEEARRGRRVLDWGEWWAAEVEGLLA